MIPPVIDFSKYAGAGAPPPPRTGDAPPAAPLRAPRAPATPAALGARAAGGSVPETGAIDWGAYAGSDAGGARAAAAPFTVAMPAPGLRTAGVNVGAANRLLSAREGAPQAPAPAALARGVFGNWMTKPLGEGPRGRIQQILRGAVEGGALQPLAQLDRMARATPGGVQGAAPLLSAYVPQAQTPGERGGAFGAQALEALLPAGAETDAVNALRGSDAAEGLVAGASRFGRIGEILGRGAARVGAEAAARGPADAAIGYLQGNDPRTAAALGVGLSLAGEGLGALADVPAALVRRSYLAEARPGMDALGAGELATPREVAATATREGIPLTAGDVFGSGPDLANQRAASMAKGLRGKIAVQRQASLDGLRGAVGRWLDELAPEGSAGDLLGRYGAPMEPEEAGRALSASAENARQLASRKVGAYFDALDGEFEHGSAAGAPLVDYRPIQEGARQVASEVAEARKAVPSLDPKVASKLTDDLASIEANLTPVAPKQPAGFAAARVPAPQAPPGLTFRAAQQIRSRLWDIGNIPSDVLPGEAQKVARRLIGALDQQMESTAKGASPKAFALWRSGNRAWGDYADTFGTRGHILNQLVSAGPKDFEGLPGKLLGTANGGSLGRLRAAQNAGIDLAPVQREFLRRGLEDGSSPGLPGLADLASKYSPGFLRSLFGEEGSDALAALRRRGLVEGVASPGGYDNPALMAMRLKRAAASSELRDLLGERGAAKARSLATIAKRVAIPYNPSGSAEGLAAMAQAVPTDRASLIRGILKRAGGDPLQYVLDPGVTEELTGMPTLGSGPSRAAAMLSRARRSQGALNAIGTGAAGAERH